mgnify:CR=1 FL=1
MTDLFLTTLLVGAAVTYVLELFGLFLGGLFERQIINLVFSIPLSTAAIYVMQHTWSIEMLATVPASTFISLFLLKYLNKPTQVEMRRVPRI